MYKRAFYYDACMLETDICYAELINDNPKRGIQAMTSHLALGEALGNTFLKGEEEIMKMITYLQNLTPFLKVKGNDEIREKMDAVRTEFPYLSSTDAMHLATAIRHSCEGFRTLDSDFKEIGRRRLSRLSKDVGSKGLAIILGSLPP